MVDTLPPHDASVNDQVATIPFFDIERELPGLQRVLHVGDELRLLRDYRQGDTIPYKTNSLMLYSQAGEPLEPLSDPSPLVYVSQQLKEVKQYFDRRKQGGLPPCKIQTIFFHTKRSYLVVFEYDLQQKATVKHVSLVKTRNLSSDMRPDFQVIRFDSGVLGYEHNGQFAETDILTVEPRPIGEVSTDIDASSLAALRISTDQFDAEHHIPGAQGVRGRLLGFVRGLLGSEGD